VRLIAVHAGALQTVCEQLPEGCERLPGGAATTTALVLDCLVPTTALLALREGEEATLCALRTVGSLLRRDAHAAAAAEPWLTPQLLQLWSNSLGRGAVSGTSPLVGDAVVDAIKPMASQLEAMPGLVERLLPVLLHVLQVSATECDYCD
jgi:hypothetical protein